jgi:polyhydroxyalkanoate synthase subunit PhaE
MFKMYELWQPMQKSFMNTGNPADAWKNIFDAAKYKEVMDNLFESLMGKNNVKELFDTYTKTVEEFFTSNNNLGKEYYANMQDLAKKMPELMSGDFAKVSAVYGQAKDVFEKAYAPLLKLVAPGKEKESIELTIAAMDKAGQYAVKQSELQYLMYTAGQKSMEQTAALVQNKMKNNTEIGSFQAFFNEWVGANEKIYLELFASEEFSKLKAEVLDLSLGLRKTLEKQFEFNFEKYPFVFKSEMEELYKNMYDLKKMVKNMQAKFGAEFDENDAAEAKAAKSTKKAK